MSTTSTISSLGINRCSALKPILNGSGLLPTNTATRGSTSWEASTGSSCEQAAPAQCGSAEHRPNVPNSTRERLRRTPPVKPASFCRRARGKFFCSVAGEICAKICPIIWCSEFWKQKISNFYRTRKSQRCSARVISKRSNSKTINPANREQSTSAEFSLLSVRFLALLGCRSTSKPPEIWRFALWMCNSLTGLYDTCLGWLLNPRPLGYECSFLVARSFVFYAFVAVRCTILASAAQFSDPISDHSALWRASQIGGFSVNTIPSFIKARVAAQTSCLLH